MVSELVSDDIATNTALTEIDVASKAPKARAITKKRHTRAEVFSEIPDISAVLVSRTGCQSHAIEPYLTVGCVA